MADCEHIAEGTHDKVGAQPLAEAAQHLIVAVVVRGTAAIEQILCHPGADAALLHADEGVAGGAFVVSEGLFAICSVAVTRGGAWLMA
ncbi:MAG: hypothetical protein FJY55_02930 [Betaproteobacteria bacterium]|nr:hypothetical protein [Betaproteobacteria bacterium]